MRGLAKGVRSLQPGGLHKDIQLIELLETIRLNHITQGGPGTPQYIQPNIAIYLCNILDWVLIPLEVTVKKSKH